MGDNLEKTRFERGEGRSMLRIVLIERLCASDCIFCEEGDKFLVDLGEKIPQCLVVSLVDGQYSLVDRFFPLCHPNGPMATAG